MRISGGRWKGRKLEVGAGARPTSSRAREALFDILQNRVPGSRVLDLCAGSGAVGLEAVSRGAREAVLVEREAQALRQNVERLEPRAGEIRILRADVRASLASLTKEGSLFDLVFADPPYGKEADLLSGVEGVLAADGLLVLQQDSSAAPPDAPAGLRFLRREPYGRNVLVFFGRFPTWLGQRVSDRF